MANGTEDNTVPDTEMATGDQPPVSLLLLNAQQKWLLERLDSFEDKLKESIAKADWTQHQLEATQRDLAAANAEIAILKAIEPKSEPKAGADEAKGADPPLFTGKQSELEGWITACRIRFAGQPSKFNTKEKKVVHATSFLRGYPMSWFQPTVNAYSTRAPGEEPPVEFQSFETFAQSLRDLFGDPNLQRNAETAIRFIQQGERTVAEYISRFAIHAQHTSYDDSSKMGYFYNGLDGTIKDKLVSDSWKTLKELQNLATRHDARARERKLEREMEAKAGSYKAAPAGTNPPRRADGTFLPAPKPVTSPFNVVARAPPTVNPFSASTPTPPAPAADGSTPMELDSQRMVPISAEEKERCILENRCFECKIPGHSAKFCRRRLARLANQGARFANQEPQRSAENDGAQE
jgi:hypothetical protein